MTRLSRILRPVNWTYALAEIFLIVAGISIALGVNAWYGARLDRLTEVEYLNRLRADLTDDISHFGRFATTLERKGATLKTLLSESQQSLLARGTEVLAEDLDFSDLVSLTDNQTATFDELRSTGNLALIRDAGIRSALADYYSGYELMSRIFAQPVGPYKEILWSSLPGPAVFDQKINDMPIDSGELRRGLQQLMSHPGLEGAVNSELHYTAGMLFWLRRFHADADELIILLNNAVE